ncbi:MAG: hypothetical protein K2O48_07465, partial [Prevotella sp.]|nr:hypothetical protein [Prevotella sp.]
VRPQNARNALAGWAKRIGTWHGTRRHHVRSRLAHDEMPLRIVSEWPPHSVGTASAPSPDGTFTS